jgi:hypothetical protein
MKDALEIIEGARFRFFGGYYTVVGRFEVRFFVFEVPFFQSNFALESMFFIG